MHGVPKDLPIDRFVGQQFNQICLGRFQIQFQANGAGSICVEGHWELRDHRDTIIDAGQAHAQREAFRVHQIIDLPITGFTIDAPRSFTLLFENGIRLTIFDDSPEHESFSVHLDRGSAIRV